MINKQLIFLLIFLFSCFLSFSQKTDVTGTITDKQSDEPIPFASVFFKKDGRGTLTDSLGKFSLYKIGVAPDDSLIINSVGYKPIAYIFSSLKDSVSISVQLVVLPPSNETVVKTKYNRALWFWHKVIDHKDQNNIRKFDNYSYEVYNKLELDLNKVDKDKLENTPVLKKFSFILKYVDSTSEDAPYLPVYLTETLSDYYKQSKPYKTREVIKATEAYGLENASTLKNLGNTYQNVNVYDNSIPVFDKYFTSPFSNNADAYYNFKLQDTQYLNKKRLVHFLFSPKHPGATFFTGDCWINDTSFAIQKITMRPSADANINYVTNLTLIQEYKFIRDSIWFLYKDKFVVDLALVGKNKLNFKGRKTTTYSDIVFNNASVTNEIAKNKVTEDIILLPNVQNKPDSFWQENRHEPLNKNEKTVYAVLDTLKKNPTFNRYRNALIVLTTGVKDIGDIRIGPYFYWFTANRYEGTRLRFDLSTNRNFSHHIYLHGYLAYGFTDQAFKGQAEAMYLFHSSPRTYVSLSYKKDIDNGQTYYDQLSSDNIFAVFLRKPGIPYKYQRIEDKHIEYYTETHNGIGMGVRLFNRQFTPLLNLPPKELFPVKDGEPLNATAVQLHVRYAYQERTYDENFDRYSLGSPFPIADITYTHGLKGWMNSSYNYDKVEFTIHDHLKLTPYGELYYNFFAGKVWGTLPYELLAMQPGNEWHYYSRNSFNLMRRFEYITDRYAGFNFEHNIGSGLFRYTKITRTLKLRQFWEVKGVVGDLSKANKQLNFVGDYPFKSLDGKLYLEVGTGIDNILKFFRVDAIWRVLPTPLPKDRTDKFGIFLGFRVSL